MNKRQAVFLGIVLLIISIPLGYIGLEDYSIGVFALGAALFFYAIVCFYQALA